MRYGKLFLSLLIVVTCTKKYPRASYLSPKDHENNGFVDQDTWQQLAYGNFFPPELPLASISALPLYYPLPEGYSYDNLPKFSREVVLQQGETSLKIRYQRYLVRDLLKIDEASELLLETHPEKGSPELAALVELKKKLFYYACDHAHLTGLYQFLLLIESSKPNGLTEEKLAALQGNFFPLRTYYFPELMQVIDILKKYLAERHYSYEVIAEKEDPRFPLRCKIVLHFKQKDLILKEKKLLSLSDVHD